MIVLCVALFLLTCQHGPITAKTRYRPGGGETICPDDGSSIQKNRGGSTSVRGRVRSPHISGGRLWLSCRQPACYSLGSCAIEQTDGRTDGSRYLIMSPWGGGIIKERLQLPNWTKLNRSSRTGVLNTCFSMELFTADELNWTGLFMCCEHTLTRTSRNNMATVDSRFRPQLLQCTLQATCQ